MNQRVADKIADLERFIASVDDAMAIPREAGAFVHTLILATGARRGLEIGTSYGYSGLWIASALAEQGGTLITIDHLESKASVARANFEVAGLIASVDLRIGSAEEVLASLEGPFDFVLNDADKENCRRYVERIACRLTDRAVVLTDNIATHAEELAGFMAWIREHPDFYSIGLDVGNGMEMSVKCCDDGSVTQSGGST